MAVIDIKSLPLIKGSEGIGYPAPHYKGCDLFEAADIGTAAQLTQFGVRIEKLLPGGMSSQRHWHENEDEFLYMLTGELVLVEDDGEHVLTEGSAAGWKAGEPNAHHLINRSDEPAFYLIIGTRAGRDVCHYPDIDLHYERSDGVGNYSHKDGMPYQSEDFKEPDDA